MASGKQRKGNETAARSRMSDGTQPIRRLSASAAETVSAQRSCARGYWSGGG